MTESTGMSEALGVGDNTLQQAVREKKWDECGADEKVERLRQHLRGLEHQVEVMAAAVDSTASKFMEHKHVDGEVMISARRHYTSNFRIGPFLSGLE